MNFFKKIYKYVLFLSYSTPINFDLSVKRIRSSAYTQPFLGSFYFFPIPPFVEMMEPLHGLFLSGIAIIVILATALFRSFFKKDPDTDPLKKPQENLEKNLEKNPPAPASSPKLTDEQFATLNFIIAFPGRVDELSSKVKDVYRVVNILTVRAQELVISSMLQAERYTKEELAYYDYAFTTLLILESIVSRDIAHMTGLNPKLVAHMEPGNLTEDLIKFQYAGCTSDYWKQEFFNSRAVGLKMPENLIGFRPREGLEGVDILVSKVYEYVFYPEFASLECLLLKQEIFDQLANCKSPAFTKPQGLELVKNKNEYCALRSSLIQPLVDIYSSRPDLGSMQNSTQIPPRFPDLVSSFFTVDADGAFRNIYMTLFNMESRKPDNDPQRTLKDSAVQLSATRQRILDTYFDADQKTLSPNVIKEISPFLTDSQKHLFPFDTFPSPDTLADTSSLAKSVANVIKELL